MAICFEFPVFDCSAMKEFGFSILLLFEGSFFMEAYTGFAKVYDDFMKDIPYVDLAKNYEQIADYPILWRE